MDLRRINDLLNIVKVTNDFPSLSSISSEAMKELLAINDEIKRNPEKWRKPDGQRHA